MNKFESIKKKGKSFKKKTNQRKQTDLTTSLRRHFEVSYFILI